MTYTIIPITNVNQIKASNFVVYNESNSYLSLDEMVNRVGADFVYEIEHNYKSKTVKTYYIPVENEINHSKQ